MEREKIRVIKSSYTCEDVTFLPIDEIIKICEDAKSKGATSVCISASTNWDNDIDEIELEFYREELESEESFEKRKSEALAAKETHDFAYKHAEPINETNDKAMQLIAEAKDKIAEAEKLLNAL